MGIKARKKKRLPIRKDEPVTLEKLIAALPKLINLIELVARIEDRLDAIEAQVDFDDLESRITDLEDESGNGTLREEFDTLSSKVEQIESEISSFTDGGEAVKMIRAAFQAAYRELG